MALLLATALMTPAALAAETGQDSLPQEPSAVHAAALTPAKTTDEDWMLRLVNPWNALQPDFTVELETLQNGLRVDARICGDLDAMLSDCRKAGLHPVICSAYRTQATQTRLYQNKVTRLRAAGYEEVEAKTEAARWVALPGTSEHETGLALDIVARSYQSLDERQEQTTEQQWLMANSWKYGFVLRYPADKGEITGIGYEPWHYRYVGKEASAAMHETGLCLEEYLQVLSAPAAELTQEASHASLPETAQQLTPALSTDAGQTSAPDTAESGE